MIRRLRQAHCVWSLIVCLLLVAGCGPTDPLQRAGVSLKMPEGWKTAPIKGGTAVPGVPIASWRGPKGALLTVYTAVPIPGGRASELVEAQANRLENLPGLKVVERGVATLAGIEAARVEAVGPGTGDALAPSGMGTPIGPPGVSLVPTRMVYLSFIRPADTLCLACYCPEAEYSGLKPEWDAIFNSITLDRGALTTSTY